MPPADSAYHIKLNGGGFVLVDGSYVQRSQQAFNPRFSTGDPNLGDLSFWQFIAQEDFAGGCGQEDFFDISKYLESSGWYMGGERPRLVGGSAVFTPANAPGNMSSNWNRTHQLLRWGKTVAEASHIVLCGYSPSLGATGERASLEVPTGNQIGIDRVLTFPASVWQRQAQVSDGGSARFLAVAVNATATVGSKITCYGTDWIVKLQQTLTGLWEIQSLAPLSVDRILAIGTGYKVAAGSSHLAFALMSMTNASWTVASVVESYSGEFPNNVLPNAVFDASGTLYFAGTEGTPITSDHVGSAVGLMTSTDATLTGGPRLSEIVNYPDFLITGIVSINGVIYLIGTRLLRQAGSNKLQHQVVQFPDTVIWRSRATVSTATRPIGMIKAVSQESRHEAYFIAPSSYDDGDLIMRINSSGVCEVGNLPHITPSTTSGLENTWMGVVRVGGGFYAYEAKSQAFYKASLRQDVALLGLNKRILELSAFGANTPLIEKTTYAVIIQLTKPLLPDSTFTVKVNETEIGTMTSADGASKEIKAPSGLNITATTFTIKIECPAGATWPGELVRVSLRFVPTQFKKHAWGLAVRCDMNQMLLNGQREGLTAEQKFQLIETAWKANQPIEYVDVDGTSYSVLVTEYSRRRPLIATNPKRRESIVSLELLEV